MNKRVEALERELREMRTYCRMRFVCGDCEYYEICDVLYPATQQRRLPEDLIFDGEEEAEEKEAEPPIINDGTFDTLIFRTYAPLIDKYEIGEKDVKDFLRERTYLGSDPSTANALIYYLIDDCPAQMKELWPFTEDDLRPYFTKMGIVLE